MKKLFAIIILLACINFSSSDLFGEELKLSLNVPDIAPELEANVTSINALKGASIDTIIITATKGNNLTWSVNPLLFSGLTHQVNGNKYVINGVPSTGTKGSHSYRITASNSKGTATKDITINVTGQNVSEDLISDDGTFHGTSEAPVTSINEIGQSVTNKTTLFKNASGDLIFSADVAIITASTDFAITSGDLFSQIVSVDVNLAIFDEDYDEYYYSMDIAGLPEWLTISGDITSSHDIDDIYYHHEFTMSGYPSSDNVISLIAGIKISGDWPILAAFASKDVTISVNTPFSPSPTPTPEPDPDPTPTVSPDKTLQALQVEINGASELETISGNSASSTFTASVTGHFGTGFEEISSENYSLTWGITPSGIKDISFSDGILSVGASADIGTYDFVVNVEAVSVASSSIRASAEKSVKVIVSANENISHDVAPVFAENIYSVSNQPGEEISITITASEGNNLTWRVDGELPEGLAGNSGEKTYTISGTLSLSDAGKSYKFTVTASNESGQAEADVTIKIQDIPPELSGSTESLRIENGHAITPITFTAAGTNITWTTTGELPNGLTGTNNADTFTISGTPSGNSAGESFTYTITAINSTGSSSKAITFSVRNPGPRPSSPDVEPDNPDNPDEPETPEIPDIPDEPDTPANPETITEYRLKPDDNINDIIDSMPNLETLDLTEANNIKSLDLSGNTSIKQIDLSGNDVIESLNLSGSAVEMIDARGCENLAEIIIEDCENLEYLDVGMTKIKSLSLKNCESLSVLICESCDLSILEIENCNLLVDVDCRYNHLANFDAFMFPDLMRLECEHQTILNFAARLTMNINELFNSFFSSESVHSSEIAINRVKNLRAFDAGNNEITLDYDEATGEIKFASLPANFTYDYDTGFDNILMDVKVFVSENEEPSSGEEKYALGPSGGCDAELSVASLIIVILFRRRRK